MIRNGWQPRDREATICEARSSANLPLLESKTRECLRCEKKFLSTQSSQRMCNNCRRLLFKYSRENDLSIENGRTYTLNRSTSGGRKGGHK